MSEYTGQVAEGANDGDETTGGVVSTSGTTSILGETKKPWWCARFPNVTIPAGAQVTSAKIEVWAKTNFTNYPMNIFIFNESNPAAIPTTAKGISGAVKKPTKPAITEVTFVTGVFNAIVFNAGLKNALSEHLLAENGWKEGNALIVVIQPTSASNITLDDFEANATHAPKLTIVYTTETGTVVTVVAFAQAVAGRKIASAGIRTQAAFTQGLSGVKKTSGTISQQVAFQQRIVSAKSVIGTVPVTVLALTQKLGASQKLTGGSVSNTLAVAQRLGVGVGTHHGTMKQAFIVRQQIVSGRLSTGSATKTTLAISWIYTASVHPGEAIASVVLPNSAEASVVLPNEAVASVLLPNSATASVVIP